MIFKQLFLASFLLSASILSFGSEAVADTPVTVPETKFPNLYQSAEPVDFSKLVKEEKSFVIQIFGPWCHYCKEEHPSLIALKKKRDDIQIYSIVVNPGMIDGYEKGCSSTKDFIHDSLENSNNLREEKSGTSNAINVKSSTSESLPAGFPFTAVAVDESGRLSAPFTGGNPMIPQTLIFKNGKFEKKVIGMLSEKEFTNFVEKVLPKPSK